MSMCGLLGTLSSIAANGVTLVQMPNVIRTRDVTFINLPITFVSFISNIIWFLYAYVKGEPFMMMSNSLGSMFNGISLLFYYWAVQVINNKDTPFLMQIMDKLIYFFKLFKASDLAQSDIMKLFWHDEDTEAALAYINAFKSDIEQLQERYEDQDSEASYEQHMRERKLMGIKLKSIQFKYDR